MGMNDSGVLSNYPTAPVQNSRTRNPTPSPAHEPIAIIGIANRLPGQSSSPAKLWRFLAAGGIAQNAPPKSRFSLKGHYDGSHKPHTIKTPGAMFLEDQDPADFDAAFFQVTVADSISMDPQQRQLLEVVYEAFESAGVTLGDVNGADYGCFVGSYAVDYLDMQLRDPEDRVDGITIGAGRAILSNRISHFFNLRGASMTIDTACSGSLVSVDVACRYLQTGQIRGAVVAGANLYLSPDQNQDMGAMRTASSASGRCHTFDAKADGYCKAEAVNCVILKRLSDAIADGDPIRSIIRGTATNSDGWTPGIASPSAEAQAKAIRDAYAAAGVEYHETGYLECHGTGTLAGDPVEVAAAASVLTKGRSTQNPLIIGSIKSNIGHSEPAAGLSGLIKAALAIEKNLIPGNPTFIDPNPRIDFDGMRVKASRTSVQWPNPSKRIASVNSFGYGGSNAHVVVQDAESFLQGRVYQKHVSSYATNSLANFLDDDENDAEDGQSRPRLLVFSANDESTLKANYRSLQRHLTDPTVSVDPYDLAYTLSDRRSRLFCRGYTISDGLTLREDAFVTGKEQNSPPRIGFVFTGQGAQWSQMGKGLIDHYDKARSILETLDAVLKSLPTPPSWSLIDELYEPRSPEHLRLPEFSQPLVTALQIVLASALREWGVTPVSVVGHSSGEIAAAYAAGQLTAEDAIKIAFYRGEAAARLRTQSSESVGMLAAGLGPEKVAGYIEDLADTVQIACYNSTSSVTLSGRASDLDTVRQRLQKDSVFARALQVDLAYHSSYMKAIGDEYRALLESNTGAPQPGNSKTTMFSSVTVGTDEIKDASYWQANMVSPVRFEEATRALLTGTEAADFLIELGPAGALAGPIKQILDTLGTKGSNVRYYPAAKRGPDSIKSLFDVAGRLFVAGGSIDVRKVNTDDREPKSLTPQVLIDLPSYTWNHSRKYWYESDASNEWRYRKYVHHDLLGSKVLGTPWSAPTFSKILDIKDVPYLKDHRMGGDIVFPAAGFVNLAIEALYQSSQATTPVDGVTQANQLTYRLRNVTFDSALVLEEGKPVRVKTTLNRAAQGAHGSWFQFTVSSSQGDVDRAHSAGLIRLGSTAVPTVSESDATVLQNTTPGRLWYKAMNAAGYGFGPLFQKLLEVESTAGKRTSRALVDLGEPPSAWDPQSPYPLHPAALDGCFQTVTPSLVSGVRSAIKSVLIPAVIDDLVIYTTPKLPDRGISNTSSEYVGKGRMDDDQNYLSNAEVHDPVTKKVILRLTGLRYHRLDTGFAPLDPHTFNRLEWKPDVSFINSSGAIPLPQDPLPAIDELLDLIAHKKPRLNVLEINLDQSGETALWLNRGGASTRAAYSSYTFVTPHASLLIKAQNSLQSARDATFILLDQIKDLPHGKDSKFDLVILRSLTSWTPESSVIQQVAKLVPEGGSLVTLTAGLIVEDYEQILQSQGIVRLLYHPVSGCLALSLAAKAVPHSSPHSVRLVSFRDDTTAAEEVLAALQQAGHSVVPADAKPTSTQGEIVLVLDELVNPVLDKIKGDQWQALQGLIALGSKTLWVTRGSQKEVSHPQNALVHGLFRTIRAEDPGLHLTTLDVQAPTGLATANAISAVLRKLEQTVPRTEIDHEYVERDGIIYVSRVLTDEPINEYKSAEATGVETYEGSLHDAKATVRLRAERLGTLDGLVFGEVAQDELPLGSNRVEVEIYAAGLNFKDVAVTMGIVPENTSLLGLEGAGVVRRVADDVTNFQPGDRVVVFEKGTFANRIQVTTERTHKIPDMLSFTEAASITGVYLTSLYALYYLGNLQEGQTVLIHSAAGGIGISSLRLAQYKKASIFVTVGTEEKRQFIEREFGIPQSRIFSSRTTDFAGQILAATNGKGVDVILNSLIGEMLDESWRIIADGGTMVEIGKRDILDRKQLAMEPFDRNATYRALDFSHKSITDELIAKLLSELFDLYDRGHIGAVRPIKEFDFTDVQSAFAFMRSGKHIGKIVISQQPDQKVIVPIRPAARSTGVRSDVSYLIVGGLKGLCGSVAIWLARSGARHITILSRSGIHDDKSQVVVKSIESYGATVYEVRGDVAVVADVRKAYAASGHYPVGGVIQGAMVLRDKPFEMMTVDHYHTTILSKVQGTINLHEVAEALGLKLSFFTLLSSVSGLVGMKGQANYAAANVFLDAFAAYRKSLNLVANSTDLGIIEDVGYMEEQAELYDRFGRHEWTPINETVLHKIIEYSILQQNERPLSQRSTTQFITGIAVPQPPDSQRTRDARFGALFIPRAANASGGAKPSNAGNEAVQAFLLLLGSAADKAAVIDAAVDVVNKQFTKVLRLDELMEPGKALTSYGLDSLAAVEFRNWIRLELGAQLTTLEISSAPSLYALCEKIVSKLQDATKESE